MINEIKRHAFNKHLVDIDKFSYNILSIPGDEVNIKCIE